MPKPRSRGAFCCPNALPSRTEENRRFPTIPNHCRGFRATSMQHDKGKCSELVPPVSGHSSAGSELS
jgi:hypothetical protein